MRGLRLFLGGHIHYVSCQSEYDGDDDCDGEHGWMKSGGGGGGEMLCLLIWLKVKYVTSCR